MNKGAHPNNRPTVSLSARQGTVMHQDRKGAGEHMVEIPENAKTWDQLPASVRKALMGEAFGKNMRLKRKLG